MSRRDRPTPKKLSHDAIVEALFEIRFETSTIPEILFGRLADYAPWKTFEQRRLPAYEIPPTMRQIDRSLRYQPVFEMVDGRSHRAVRIGAQVLSYHRTSPYVGWTTFAPELRETIEGLFKAAQAVTITRLGLRYMNALQPALHLVSSVSELDLTLSVAGSKVAENLNINFATALSDDTQCTVRVATNEFVQGLLPPGTAVVVDVDVSTKEMFRTTDIKRVKDWIEFAHTNEKEQFFRLLTDETIDGLKEE